MRVGTALALMTGALLFVATGAWAAPQPPPAAQQDSVSGSGTVPNCGGDNRFVADASSGPSGENPTGSITCGILFGGPVSCLHVEGNVAIALVPSTDFGPVSVRITDNGTSDTVEAYPTAFAGGAPGCPEPLSSYSTFPFTGSLVVVDAPPAPTDKGQCKDGGYARFGFKNQGQCVASVQRPKP
jgi:hypothetical protein